MVPAISLPEPSMKAEGYLGGAFFWKGSDLRGSFLHVLFGGMFLLDLGLLDQRVCYVGI